MNAVSPTDAMAFSNVSGLPAALLETLFEAIPFGIAVFDPHMRLLRWNPTWLELTVQVTRLLPAEIHPGVSLSELAPEIWDLFTPHAGRVLQGDTIQPQSLLPLRGLDAPPLEISFMPIRGDGVIIGILAIVKSSAVQPGYEPEILEQLVAERTQEIENRQRIAASLGDILSVLNSSRSLQGALEYICKIASQLLGSSACVLHHIEREHNFVAIQASYNLPEQLKEIPGFIMYSSSRADYRIMNRQAVWTSDFRSLPSTSQEEMEGMDADVLRWREVTDLLYRAWLAVPLVVRDEVYGSLAFYYTQAHRFADEEIELAQTFADQAALAIENASLRLQAEENAAVAERDRLARDLHDAVTQTLFAASLIAEVLPRLWERDRDEGLRRLGELRELTRGALAEMRTLLLELRPMALEEANLAELFRHLVDAFTGRARVPARLFLSEEPIELPPEVKIALYRVTQEALNNIIKHARASQVEVRLQWSVDGIDLSIQDDGCGFDLASAASDHLGLCIMQERAASIGAELAIESKPGAGTRISAVWSFPSSNPKPEPRASER